MSTLPLRSFEDMEVDPGIDIDIGAVALFGIFPVRAAQDALEFVEPGLEILALRGALREFDDGLFRVDKDHRSAAGPEAVFAGAFTVEFEEVAAGDCGRLEVVGAEAVDGDAVFADFDFLLDHVDAEVVALSDGTGVVREEDLDETGCAGTSGPFSRLNW
jgi:hypothetical protein